MVYSSRRMTHFAYALPLFVDRLAVGVVAYTTVIAVIGFVDFLTTRTILTGRGYRCSDVCWAWCRC